MSVLNAAAIVQDNHDVIRFRQLDITLAAAIDKSPRAALLWLRENLPLRNTVNGDALDLHQLAATLERYGYKPAPVSCNLSNLKGEELARTVIGQIVTSIQQGDTIGLPQRAQSGIGFALMEWPHLPAEAAETRRLH